MKPANKAKSFNFFLPLYERYKTRLWLFAIVSISAITLTLILSISKQLQLHSKKDLEKELLTVLNFTKGAIHLWRNDLQTNIEALSQLPKLRQIIQDQILHQGDSKQTERLEDLQQVLRPWTKTIHYLSFTVFRKNLDGNIEPLFQKGFRSQEVFAQKKSLLDSSFTGFQLGEAFVTTDPLLLAPGRPQELVMIATMPIKNSSGVTIASIAFSINILTALMDVTQLGRFGASGETYIINELGQILTSRRFETPVGNKTNVLVGQFKNSKNNFKLSEYLDYRGVEVVSGWIWDKNLNLALVTEVDKVEAYHSYEMVRKLVWIIITIIIIGMTLLILLREARSRNIRKIESMQQTDAARKELLAVVSHDLKNPLSALLMTNELLLKTLQPDLDPSAKRKKLLERSHRAAEQMRRLITDLLDSAKIEAGKLIIHPIECSATQILVNALDVIEPIANEKGLQLSQNIPDNLPLLNVDPERVLQILSNLLGNAIKFTAEGGEIKIQVTFVKPWVKFTIIDNGTGISKSDLPHLFERYWQAKKTMSFGTGLGLTICKELVTAHGGQIWAESDLGQGTTFHFTLPISQTSKT